MFILGVILNSEIPFLYVEMFQLTKYRNVVSIFFYSAIWKYQYEIRVKIRVLFGNFKMDANQVVFEPQSIFTAAECHSQKSNFIFHFKLKAFNLVIQLLDCRIRIL